MFRSAPPPGFTREEVAGLLCLAVVVASLTPLLAAYWLSKQEG